MSIFKHHDKGKPEDGEADKPRRNADNDAALEEHFDGTEDPIQREHDEAEAREARAQIPPRPPGI
ncbi:hypothetical protein [Demequina oxidasica]|uniref:hypothetical protein n=1 Tax=Demequina oxidasica TaxID=676199 RepID=UPI0007844760|nr:hypothetical protein [Demequina oxidasica]